MRYFRNESCVAKEALIAQILSGEVLYSNSEPRRMGFRERRILRNYSGVPSCCINHCQRGMTYVPRGGVHLVEASKPSLKSCLPSKPRDKLRNSSATPTATHEYTFVQVYRLFKSSGIKCQVFFNFR